MKHGSFIITVAIAAFGFTACAPVQVYHPEPIVPALTAKQFESRSLLDPQLRHFMEVNLGQRLETWPLKSWNLNELALAAYYFNPQMSVAREQSDVARAGIITAGERPNPTVSLRPGIPSPYLLSLFLDVPVQPARRRGYKIKQARALSQAARFNVALTAWSIRSQVRAALVSYLSDARLAGLAALEAHLEVRQVKALNAQWLAGEIAHPALASAKTNLDNAQMAASAAEARVLQDRAALAAAIGVPVAALNGIRLRWRGFAQLPSVKALSPGRIQHDAVLNRLDVRQALAEYAAAQAALQLEIARQHPNFQIGPGYDFEEGRNYFVTDLAAVLPIFNRNQGPIAQAEAARKLAAARLTAVQAQAIAQSEAALQSYRAALAEWHDTEKAALEIRQVLEPLSRQSVIVGETNWLALNGVQIQGVSAGAAALSALARAQQALGQLEDAVERPLEEGEAAPAFRTAPVRAGRRRKQKISGEPQARLKPFGRDVR